MGELTKVGLVLAGGGAKGAYQIGALKALQELGITEKIGPVAGTSIGGINLALYSSIDMEKAENVWRNFKGLDFVDFDDNGFDVFKEGDGIFSRTALLDILDKNVDYSKITNSENNYYVTVCYKEAGTLNHKYVKLNGMNKEHIRQFMMATSAIPIVYDAVEIDGQKYSDGGQRDNTPVKPISKEDVNEIIVISNDHTRDIKADYDKFPDKKIINIIPSASLHLDSIEGTVDLVSVNSVFRIKLGYLDAKAIINAYLNDRPIPDLSGNQLIARQELKMVKLENKANTTLSNLDAMLKKYGID